MAKLYFYYGAMGSSKTANALMTHFNYEEVGQKALLCKPKIDDRFGKDVIHSRIGLEHESIFLEDLIKMSKEEIQSYDCIIVDEVQFATREQVDFLSDIADFYDVPVVCYGLRADFRNELFPGSARMLAIADVIKELKTVCWCGKKATCNTRYNENGIVRDGPQVVLGGNDSYVALCRKHFKEGKIRKDN
ncbi:MAG: thymidine kinase [Lachnospiraceae bacterium]|nr:thymidine kinase [Lachnospiraceae bacterium]MBR1844910.1 thymidine kinase [Lachnospiraceae bacterium]